MPGTWARTIVQPPKAVIKAIAASIGGLHDFYPTF